MKYEALEKVNSNDGLQPITWEEENAPRCDLICLSQSAK